jgi:hypothetical protein
MVYWKCLSINCKNEAICRRWYCSDCARFNEKIYKDGPINQVLGTPCYLWTAAIRSKNYCPYGTFYLNGDWILSHIFSYWVNVGDIPEGKWILHSCDNPPCVNPAHLFLGDRSVNMKDCANKGRLNVQVDSSSISRENNVNAKLVTEDVVKIRKMFDEGYMAWQIAKKFNISTKHAYEIKWRNVWKSV